MSTQFPKPGDEYCEPVDENGKFLDRERFVIERFRCPSCGHPLELFENRRPHGRDPQAGTLIAACRGCEIHLPKPVWREVIADVSRIPVWHDDDLPSHRESPEGDGEDISY